MSNQVQLKEELKEFATGFNLFRNAVKREEFIEAFKALQLAVRKVADLNAEKRAELERLLTTLSEKVRGESGETLENVKKEVKKQLETLKNAIEDKLDEVKDGRTPIKGIDYVDGINADNELIISTLTSRLPTAEKLALEVIKNGEATRDGLELLEGKERFRAELKIEELEKEIEELKKRPKAARMGMRKVPIIKRENLTSQTDGATRAFTLPRDTVAILAVGGTDFPINWDIADWTFTGQTLTLSSSLPAPTQGSTLFALIEVLFY